MIVDLILDRRDNMKCGKDSYKPHDFYFDCMAYGDVGAGITRALDEGTEHDVKRELIKYIVVNNYSLDIIDFILSAWWINQDDNARITGIIKQNHLEMLG